LLNRIYDDMRVYYNLFQPVLRQIAKQCEGSPEGQLILHRQHDVARTPFERLQATPCLSEQALDDLHAIYEVNNPQALKRSIQEQLNTLPATCKPLSGKEAD
jgi:hypothetical protein